MKKTILILLLLMGAFGGLSAEDIMRAKGGVFVSEDHNLQANMAAGEALEVNAAGVLTGTISISTGGNMLEITYRKVLNVPTKSEAAEYAEIIDVEIEENADRNSLFLRAPAEAPWSGSNNSGRVEAEIKLPEGCRIIVNSAYFDIDAVGPFAGFSVAESLSKITVSKVRGPVDIKVSNRQLLVDDCVGPLAVTNKYGRIKVENVDTEGNSGYVRNENGEVFIENYRGSLELRSDLGRIVGRGLFLTGDDNEIRNKSAAISLSFDSLTTGKLRVNNRYGKIEMEVKNRTDAHFICKVERGSKVQAEYFPMTEPFVAEGRLEFSTGKGNAEVRITARGDGDIIIQGSERDAIGRTP